VNREILFKDGQFYYKLSDVLEILDSLGTKITKKQFIKQLDKEYKKHSIFFNMNLSDTYFYKGEELYISVRIFNFLEDKFIKKFKPLFPFIDYYIQTR
jgi:hypothetical protein